MGPQPQVRLCQQRHQRFGLRAPAFRTWAGQQDYVAVVLPGTLHELRKLEQRHGPHGTFVFQRTVGRVRPKLDIADPPRGAHLVERVGRKLALFNEIGEELAEHAVSSFATNAGITLHVSLRAGTNVHHIIEATFKGLARCLRDAVRIDPHDAAVPSTKGTL